VIKDKRFSGYATKMKLTSYVAVNPKVPLVDAEQKQQITVNKEGRIWYSGYGFDENMKFVNVRKFQDSMSKEMANYLLAWLGYYFSSAINQWTIDSDKYWEIELTNEKEEVFKFTGLIKEKLYELDKISKWLRGVLDTSRAYVFDGNVRWQIATKKDEKIFVAVKPMLYPDDEVMWYFTEDKEIKIGDKYHAETRNGVRGFVAEVVDIIVAKPENGPVTLKKQEKMKSLTARAEIPAAATSFAEFLNGMRN